MQLPQLILIDVDGTLVDSVPDLAYCVDEMQKLMDMPLRGEAAVRQWVGNGVPRLVERALSNDLNGTPDIALYDKAYPIFLEIYQDNVSKRSCLYPGVKQGLEWLKAQNLHMGCITNKAARFTEPLLKDLGVADYFNIIISGDTLPRKKPDPMPLLHGAEFFSVKPKDSIMLGDSVSDVKAARAAGFGIICMSYGYNHGEDINLANPDVVIDSFTQLPDVLS
ncbi:phosphoglycolate phosphatase [Candidatus Venteria ishoeyi]|uniref:Phosphoglycolate phosphatase n=1 Tax=Candidatus Venteria ishoeyi TaxID=1899563 RepID=A0A1H6FBJ6_9GAMM|nr:phosphoglycolate phosphatase [Candidatus Venteria ishoeyi]MDM8546943.1 phosphoglycolate phosphatase [Candidatus Venteria ishoeyi]SEH07470.1 Phosphoglycolate phosphatase [Candidatus Venteria ishoeyi]